jgi:hypothetical protein
MKKYLAIIGAVLATASVSFAQATLTISGNVAAVSSISIASAAGYNSLDLVNNASAKKVGTATEISNDKAGYKVTLSSLNAGSTAQAVLKGVSGNADFMNYSITYGGTPVTLASGNAQVTSVTARTGSTGVQKDIAVSYTGAWLAADTYSDTLTLTIVGN